MSTVVNFRRAAAWRFPRLGPPARKALVSSWPAAKWLYRVCATLACWVFALIWFAALLHQKGFYRLQIEMFDDAKAFCWRAGLALILAVAQLVVGLSTLPLLAGVAAAVFLCSVPIWLLVKVVRAARA